MGGSSAEFQKQQDAKLEDAEHDADFERHQLRAGQSKAVRVSDASDPKKLAAETGYDPHRDM